MYKVRKRLQRRGTSFFFWKGSIVTQSKRARSICAFLPGERTRRYLHDAARTPAFSRRDGTIPSFSINVKYNAHSSTYRYIVAKVENPSAKHRWATSLERIGRARREDLEAAQNMIRHLISDSLPVGKFNRGLEGSFRDPSLMWSCIRTPRLISSRIYLSFTELLFDSSHRRWSARAYLRSAARMARQFCVFRMNATTASAAKDETFADLRQPRCSRRTSRGISEYTRAIRVCSFLTRAPQHR